MNRETIAAFLEDWQESWWGDRSQNPVHLAAIVLDAIEEQGLASGWCLAKARQFLRDESSCRNQGRRWFNPWWHLRWCKEFVQK